MHIPDGFPPIIFPADNFYSKDRWLLGKKLFFEKKLSRNQTISCVSCHKSEIAFSDEVNFSVGDNNVIGISNAPTLANVSYHPYYTRAGGVTTLEMQILIPIQEHDEFNFSVPEIIERLSKDSIYKQAAKKSYNRGFDAYVLVRAIANYERSFISGNSYYDKHQLNPNQYPYNSLEQEGEKLFFSSRTHCATCHSGFNFTNYTFQNIGLYVDYKNTGRMRLTLLNQDKALFKVPTLRNIALTKPYMHDGSILNLEEVIEHYNSGGKNHINKSPLIKPLNLNLLDKQALKAFLLTLSDNEFITNKNFKE